VVEMEVVALRERESAKERSIWTLMKGEEMRQPAS
jgi:hypothetical protein